MPVTVYLILQVMIIYHVDCVDIVDIKERGLSFQILYS